MTTETKSKWPPEILLIAEFLNDFDSNDPEAEVLLPTEGAYGLLKLLDGAGFALVPKEPTPEMLEAAYYEALAEDAAGVWRTMIESATQTVPHSAKHL